MKLISADASPFARKARVVILELDLADKVEIVNPGAVTPVSNNDVLNAANPLGILPALVLDSGESIVDSSIICDYFIEVAVAAGKQSLYPAELQACFKSKSLHAFADGMMDTAVATRYENALRPEELRWADWTNIQMEKISRALDHLESECKHFSNDPQTSEPQMGEIACACALGYLDFRYADMGWRNGRTDLSAWFEAISSRASLSATVPG